MIRWIALLGACATALYAARPGQVLATPLSPIADSSKCTVQWSGSMRGACSSPAICPAGDAPAVIDITLIDQFGAPSAGVGASQITATGGCALAGGSPCMEVVTLSADGSTDARGHTTLTVARAGGVCGALEIYAGTIHIKTLSYGSWDYTADLAVDLGDLGLFASAYNRSTGAGYDPGFDYDCNGVVGLSDLSVFAKHFGHHCP